jgi:hypothetical protein
LAFLAPRLRGYFSNGLKVDDQRPFDPNKEWLRKHAAPLRDCTPDKSRRSVSEMSAGIVPLRTNAADFSDENDAHFGGRIEKDLVVVGKPLCLCRLLRIDDSLQGIGQV